jgi:prephenate dehydrogenase
MTIGVYGTGRFGAFWATLLSRHADVVCFNRSDRPAPSGARTGSEPEVLAADALFLCVAISAISGVIDRIAPLLGPETVVMDTCSVKVAPTAAMLERIPNPSRCLGTHPMFGPDSAVAGVAGLPIVVSPLQAEDALVGRWCGFFARLGLRVVRMSPQEHDHEAAFSQGVTHFVGRLLADLNLSPSPIGTVGYIKLLEVIGQTCNDPYQLFLDLQRYNPYTAEMRARLRTSLEKLLHVLDRSNPAD